MLEIKDLKEAHIERRPEFTPAVPIDLNDGYARIPVILLVDVSASMYNALPFVNKQIQDFKSQIRKGNTGEQFIVDLAIVTFGEDEVKCFRDFDLLRTEEGFHLSVFSGRTPMGSALFLTYKYSQLRKEQYREAGISYRQPLIVIVSDFGDNDTAALVADGKVYRGFSIYKEMAELFNELFALRKLAVVAIGVDPKDPKYELDQESMGMLNVFKTTSSDNMIGGALAEVFKAFHASLKMKGGKRMGKNADKKAKSDKDKEVLKFSGKEIADWLSNLQQDEEVDY
ncbi:MAG: hypothetical protein LBU32_28335 [Clostridiales bacterium]|nr:hypothetical protein [Clostridiales bacterium]